MTAAQLIARNRRAEDMSREALALAVQLPSFTARKVERIENGRPIRLDEAVAICEVLPELSISQLVDAVRARL